MRPHARAAPQIIVLYFFVVFFKLIKNLVRSISPGSMVGDKIIESQLFIFYQRWAFYI